MHAEYSVQPGQSDQQLGNDFAHAPRCKYVGSKSKINYLRLDNDPGSLAVTVVHTTCEDLPSEAFWFQSYFLTSCRLVMRD